MPIASRTGIRGGKSPSLPARVVTLQQASIPSVISPKLALSDAKGKEIDESPASTASRRMATDATETQTTLVTCGECNNKGYGTNIEGQVYPGHPANVSAILLKTLNENPDMVTATNTKE
ncbi:hypothetical protein Purlil1_13850 [Purpureocillium lilacinum]|uniref:Uncharacterized protein n=1 Tax=Purpureocillium lilacinum TaxID=33203 RepID=A0ABR0BCX3_PURLI|nr:hypothetical protein Purlil1_13850 [Purpureocillium lilacinum]